MGGNSRRTTLQFIDRHREGRAQHGSVVLHLMRQVEFLAALDGNGGAEHATGIF